MEAFQPQTLCDLLRRVALAHPTQGLTFLNAGVENDFVSYADLLVQAHANGNKLRDAGIVKSGKVVVVYFDKHKQNVIWTWSVIAAGGVPAILPAFSNDPKTHEGQLQNLQTIFGTPCMLTSINMIDQLHGLPDTSIHAVESIDLPIRRTTGIDGAFGYGAHAADSLAVLLFTSGSTGHSKAVEYTHRQLITSVQAKKQLHDLDESVSFMSWISFDHSANFCELHLNAMNTGAQQYFVPAADMVQRPDRFFELLGQYKIGYTFSPNSFLAVASRAWEQDKSSRQYEDNFNSLRVLMVGGEANKVATLGQADRILRDGGAGEGVVKAAYGLSETCSACFYNLQTPSWDLEQGNLFATVGKHIPIGLELRLVNEEQEPVTADQDGKIQVRGDIVFPRYYNNETATINCRTEDGWFDTGDLGRIDTGGNLAIVGRLKEILILGGNNYSSFELENAIESRKIPGLSLSWTAAFSVWDQRNDTEGVVVLFNPSGDIAQVAQQLRATISSINEAVLMFCSTAPLHIIPLPREQMPKSTIGKLSRQKLKECYLAGQFDSYRVDATHHTSASPLTTDMQHIVAELIAKQLNLNIINFGANSELAQFGMTSIGYLRLKRSIEVAINSVDPIPMPLFLEAHGIEDVASLAERSQAGIEYQPLVTLRAEGSRPPLFLFPPGGGEFMVWLPLLQYIEDRPVYALRVKGLERVAEQIFESLEEMLDCYEAAILAACPRGPYALLGLCFGGSTAFEIGKRLESKGHELAFCGGLDNPPDLQHVLRVGRDNMKDFIIDMLVYHKVIPSTEASVLDSRYADVPEEEAVLAMTSDFRDRGLLDAGLTAEKIEAWYRVNSMAYRFAKAYEPSGTVEQYSVIWANPCPSWNIDLAGWEGMVKRWEPFARKECEYLWVEGHHFSLLEDENVEGLAKALCKAMQRQEKTSKVVEVEEVKRIVAKDSAIWVRD